MRNRHTVEGQWKFIREDVGIGQAGAVQGEMVVLPHTWNAQDGQDGGNDYYRGACWYVRGLEVQTPSPEEEVWLEFAGVAMAAQVYADGKLIGTHEGGYSVFRVNLTEALAAGAGKDRIKSAQEGSDTVQNGSNMPQEERNASENAQDAERAPERRMSRIELAVRADNSANRRVYPQKADFTFYGGIYREVSLIRVPKAHFALGADGGNGMKATPCIAEGETDGSLSVELWTENAADGTPVLVRLEDADGVCAAQGEAQVSGGHAALTLEVLQVHRWNGTKDPYLYTVRAVLGADSGETICRLGERSGTDAERADVWPEKGGAGSKADYDEISVRVGFRNVRVDSERGFFLNGVSCPLCGVSRHQDRRGAGAALTKRMHEEDMAMIRELGANTIRLAHYQHDPYFYDLCDEAGLIVWAEIPYITEHMEEGRENTLSQMQELVVQNYHHPSIVCWGLSNEITASGGVSEELLENHRVLNDLCHRLDPTRWTTMAHVFFLETDSELVRLPDIRSYNLYYGWYVGEMEENDRWFDEFHRKYPETVIGLSEYGADALPCYQSPEPVKGDYTESYQAIYHEHMLQMWKQRPYIWAMHVWNMFDFAADGRSDGGEAGVNHKGLVTFDRKIKKDAFYIYKAYLSDEPFVHLCGRRYVDRAQEETEIKVYSNQDSVTLYVDGKEYGTLQGEKVFRFRVPLQEKQEAENNCVGEYQMEARVTVNGETIRDQMTIRRVREENPAYRMPAAQVVNWFDREDMQVREGYFSIKDSMAQIKSVPEAAVLLERVMAKAAEAYGDVARNVTMPESVRKQMDAMSLESMLRQAGKAVTADMVVELNRALNKIRKPEA
ncbi:MAG: glycoside hydrolase family 2 TIM barrel-domain containing protein [Eubacteriales bacterium]|nr:glycoside hydrolase family 2 TIM barrel-domain containing protein [Eubacteriales bacterium]